jgi:phosphatidylserine/phosphatidylglycerophosphate/cardiolipin synthase-like enzyme
MIRLVSTVALAACLSAPIARAGEAFPPAARFTVAFSPGDSMGAVVEAIREAKASIYVAAYSFTSRPVAVELHNAAKRDVKVFVLADAIDAGKGYSAVRYLANQGVPVRLNARYAIQHNKFMVIDNVTVQTGSLNYTAAAAQRNAENVLVIRGAPDLARSYAIEWRRLWDEGTDLAPNY